MRELVYKAQKAFIGATSTEGSSYIDCFDKCLVKLGLGNVSIFKITSILPPNIRIVTSPDEINVSSGVNIPAVYTFHLSDAPGETIASAVTVGKTKNGPTLVTESSGKTETGVVKQSNADLERMAHSRDLAIHERLVKSTECTVKEKACTLAIVAEIG
ncbi:MAG: hypothetical protein GWO20_12095 [Candidatus Korarchaeota archaeon]|nr:hypothetical protein [Candidatus Korarchaeota archaeon]NIU84172.1 hypothetical protein [Candidatus Thorarchaeota archaeon]NIW14317.1 hypothetical protein [Candidatus Thorarchaeota archaeon]NIW52414.1 hypothetical protein [Candidatus Korarchaeota archaeon]